MAEAVRELPVFEGTGRSLSDRPFAYRALYHSYRFMVDKPLGGFGVLIIFLLILGAAFTPILERYDPSEAFYVENPNYDPELADQALDDPTIKMLHPDAIERTVPLVAATWSWDHWMGTDRNGHDLYSRIVNGTQLALLVGVGGALIATLLGIFFGVISAYFGGLVDTLIQRVVDSLQAFPGLILLLLISQTVSTPNKYLITVALGIVGVAAVIRIVRSAVLVARGEQFITAAKTIGASDPRIMARHILPNIMAPIIVIFTISIGTYILAEATLAFIGLGDPSAISWGKMVNEGRTLGASNPWMAFWVGSALTVTVLAFNLAGDALRDVLDPRLRGRGGKTGF